MKVIITENDRTQNTVEVASLADAQAMLKDVVEVGEALQVDIVDDKGEVVESYLTHAGRQDDFQWRFVSRGNPEDE